MYIGIQGPSRGKVNVFQYRVLLCIGIQGVSGGEVKILGGSSGQFEREKLI